MEESESHHFSHKHRINLSKTPSRFNGLSICCNENGSLSLEKKEKIDNLQSPYGQKQFASMRELAQYVGVNVRPDICAPVQLIAPGNTPTSTDEFKALEKVIKFLESTADTPLTVVPLDLTTVKLVLISDASFANAKELKRQLGYVIALVDSTNKCKIVHYGSNRCRRVVRSVMGAEVQAPVLGFDYIYVIRQLLMEILGRFVEIEAYTDSRTVFNTVAQDGNTIERRLQIDIAAQRKSYEQGELTKIGWIPGPENVADALTKPVLTTLSPLWKLL